MLSCIAYLLTYTTHFAIGCVKSANSKSWPTWPISHGKWCVCMLEKFWCNIRQQHSVLYSWKNSAITKYMHEWMHHYLKVQNWSLISFLYALWWHSAKKYLFPEIPLFSYSKEPVCRTSLGEMKEMFYYSSTHSPLAFSSLQSYIIVLPKWKLLKPKDKHHCLLHHFDCEHLWAEESILLQPILFPKNFWQSKPES